MADIKFMDYVKENKWRLRFFSFAIGLLLTAFIYLINPNSPIGAPQNFVVSSLAVGYLIYIFQSEHAKRIYSIVSNGYKKLLNRKIYNIWFYSLLLCLLVGSVVVLLINLGVIALIWLFTILALLIIYPCIVSVSVYVPAYQYLRHSSDDKIKKKTILDSLFIATIGLCTPWILILFFISAFISAPFWVNYFVVLGIYPMIFFIAVYFPYYQSMEDVKSVKIEELNNHRKKLVEGINGNDVTERIAIELNIERIDREIECTKSESSHPYLLLKPIAGFLVVSIFAQLLVEIMKIYLNIR